MKNIENEVSNPICCQNVFCIYWKQEHCLLDRLSIDQQGLCTNCIYVDIPDSYLDKKRSHLRAELKSSEGY